MFLKKKRCFILIGLIVILTELSCSNNNIGFNSANIVPLIDNLSHEKVILEFSKFPYESDAYYGFPKTEKISKDNLISFNFTDEKSVLNISDDELRMIAWQDYHTSDFFSQGTFSFFEFKDCPLLKFGDYPFGDEYGELLYDEEVYTYLFNDKIEKMDLNNPYPLEDAKDYINKELEQTLRPYGDEMNDKAENESIQITGENDDYIDYEVRYTLEKQINVHRRVYFRHLVRVNSEENDSFYYLGDIDNTDEVEKTFDLYLNGSNSDFTKVIYRNTEKNSKQVLYKAYCIESQFDETDGKWYGRLFKENFVVDTKTHEIRQYEEMIKQTEIE